MKRKKDVTLNLCKGGVRGGKMFNTKKFVVREDLVLSVLRKKLAIYAVGMRFYMNGLVSEKEFMRFRAEIGC